MLRSGFMLLYCGLHIPLLLMTAEGNSQTSEPASVARCIDLCNRMLHEISEEWSAVQPHLIAFERLSTEVKRLINACAPADPATMPLGNEMPKNINTASNSDYGQPLTYWDTPLDLAIWDDLMNSDDTMHAVFGFNFNEFQQGKWSSSLCTTPFNRNCSICAGCPTQFCLENPCLESHSVSILT